ncbi:ABC transporter permease [Rhodoferax sp.]|uniref:ABC transporter permease n=1 Tax=Rhodoferax sp. TaxID=50421 RepID=UPI002ACEF891|nr:ABC transporter permease [Rhodoferax sp.]MDZ7920329.1 ABC transporter permease [Rhodoferax sp.]
MGALALLPLGGSVVEALRPALDLEAWALVVQHPQTWRALSLSVWTGLLSSAIAVAATAWILASVVDRTHTGAHILHIPKLLAPLLAVPHAAFAIGLLALLAPSGWLLRLLSPWATGLTAPPPWPTTQDPWGLGLIAVLVCKEIPFLLWAALAHLQRPDVARRLQQELRLAYTLGYSARAAWWRVGWPQLLPRLTAPLLAVLAYGLTVVDVALLIGPTTPPTLAVLAWQWLQDADPAVNAQGAAAAWLLAGVLALCAALGWGLLRTPWMRQRWTRGAPAHASRAPTASGPGALAWLVAVYGAVMLALLLGSVIGPWPFPKLWPDAFTTAAWQGVARSSGTVWTTMWLALASSGAALLWAVAWLEWAPARWQLHARPVLMLPLVLPAVLWVVGLHRLSLAWGLDTTGTGLWLAHTLASLPYVLIALQGPYQGFDPRLRQVSASLGHGHAVFLLRVKWPLLRSALAASAAIGFAVSVAQYLPTLYVGAGRFATVTTEAVNLAAGGQRSLTAAFAWLQWLLPVLVFALAARLGRARRF